LKDAWTPHDIRDQVIDFVNRWSEKTELPAKRFVAWIGIGTSKFHHWKGRYGKVNEHNATIPRDHWLHDWEKKAIVDFHSRFPLEGYRRLTFMMLDQDIVAVSPPSVYRVLKQAGLLERFNGKPSRKGTGFVQPLRPHEHWHVDVSYLNIAGTFYFLCSILDGYSRFIVHWEIRETMKEGEVETILQRAREKFPDVTPRIISDNGPQFVAKDFKEFIRICGMTHVRTSVYYPQSNGKLERYHRTIKADCIRKQTPLSREDAERIVSRWVDHYNTIRLHSAIGYVTPKDKLEGREPEIFAQRDRKLEAARERRKTLRQTGDSPTKPAIDFPAARAAISMAEVLQLLHFQAMRVAGHQQRGSCPIHGPASSRSRSFAVNLASNTFYCFKCAKGGNQLDLWAAATKQSIYDAVLDLCNRLQRPVPCTAPEQRRGTRGRILGHPVQPDSEKLESLSESLTH
jgi:putative transposase